MMIMMIMIIITTKLQNVNLQKEYKKNEKR